MTVQIKRRYNFDDWELIAEYEDGEFEGDEDFVESFGWLEGQDPEEVMERFDGPNLVAVQSEQTEKEGVSSGTSGAGSATYGGAAWEDEDDEDAEDSQTHQDSDAKKSESKGKSDSSSQNNETGVEFVSEVTKKTSFTDTDIKIIAKEWQGPKEGPQGGTFWVNSETGEKRYQEQKPGEDGGESEGPESESTPEYQLFGEESEELANIVSDGEITVVREPPEAVQDIMGEEVEELELGIQPRDSDGEEGNWGQSPGTPKHANPGAYGDSGIDAQMSVEDWKDLQSYIGTQTGPDDISPEEWWDAAREDDVEKYAEILQGEREPADYAEDGLPIPFIEIGQDGHLRSVQEGRHRALAAEKAGLDSIPFRIYQQKDREGVDDHVVKNTTFADMDNEFMKFYQNVVWWKSDEEDPDLSKAPNMWESDENVPDFVEEFLENAAKEDAFWQGDFENLPMGAGNRMQDVFVENMTQPQGWSLSSLVDDLQEEFAGMTKEKALEIARNETAALANKAREEAYEARDNTDEYEFYWSGPEDHRTTPICSWLKKRTNPKHGGTPAKGMAELRDLFDEAAEKAEEFDGATPERFEEYVPHYQCRHTFVRKVYL